MGEVLATDELERLTEALDVAVRAHGAPVFDRGLAVQSCESTQDEARRLCDARPGLVLLACNQRAGRGRLGRAWFHGGPRGVAMTFVLDARAFSAERLALIGAIGAYRACRDCMLDTSAEIGLRWPNDVVERITGHAGRKLAGVLVEVEASRGLAHLGIGINVRHEAGDWPEELRGMATSLNDLGAAVGRTHVISALVRQVAKAATKDLAELAREFMAADAMVGTRQRFMHDGREYAGEVASIDPTAAIVVKDASGVMHTLPALTTSLIKDN